MVLQWQEGCGFNHCLSMWLYETLLTCQGGNSPPLLLPPGVQEETMMLLLNCIFLSFD